MILYIFDKGYNLVGLTEEYTSLTWLEQYTDKGSFELHCVDSAKNIEYLRQDYFVWAQSKRTAMIIKYVKYNEDEMEIEVHGYTALELLTDRIIFPTYNADITEKSMHEMVMEAFNITEDEEWWRQSMLTWNLEDLEQERDNMFMLVERMFNLETVISEIGGVEINFYVLEITDQILPTLNSYIKRIALSYDPSTTQIKATETIGTQTTTYVITEDSLYMGEFIEEEHARRIKFYENQSKLLLDENRRNPDITTPFLINGYDGLAGYEEEYHTQFSKVNVLEAETVLGTETGLGFFMQFDYKNKRNIFTVYKGTDRTYGNGKVEPVLFSPEFGNQQNSIIIDDMTIFKNVAYVAGDKDFMFEKRADFNENMMYRKHVVVGDAKGKDRHEIYVEANNIQQIFTNEYGTETVLTDDEYEMHLRTAGIEKLNETVRVQSFYGEVDPGEFGTKYYLGDIVSCKSEKYGVRVDARITEYREILENDMRTITLTFGEPKISFMKGMRLWL